MANDRQLYLGNVPFQTTGAKIREAFAALGIRISDVRIVIDQDTKRPRGFAFLDLALDEDRPPATVAELADGLMLEGRAIRVAIARPRPPQAGKPQKAGGRQPDKRMSYYLNHDDSTKGDKKRRGHRGRRGAGEFGGPWNEDD